MTYQVKCSVCGKMIGFYGFGKHVAKHKRELGNDCYKKNKQTKLNLAEINEVKEK